MLATRGYLVFTLLLVACSSSGAKGPTADAMPADARMPGDAMARSDARARADGRAAGADASDDAGRMPVVDGAVSDASADVPEVPLVAPDGSVFAPPAPNACQSTHDQFYEAEPGVYAYWALCELGTSPAIHDYVGPWDMTSSFGNGGVVGGSPGPVADGETAATVADGTGGLAYQDITLNTHAGTIATWIKADATTTEANAVSFSATSGKSSASIGLTSGCLQGEFTNSSGTATTVSHCGYAAYTWHRLVLTWLDGALALYVDGASVATGTATGALDNSAFYYQLFPNCCSTGKAMTLAKSLLANQAWGAAQVSADYSPTIVTPPAGGLLVTTTTLGTIHKDVLGFMDTNQDLSTSARSTALLSGLTAAGVTSVRYGGGTGGGIQADLTNWQGGVMCVNGMPGVTVPASNATSDDVLTTFIPDVAKPLGLSVGYTVNYGTNPPACSAGGDPTANGADLVAFANGTQHYGIKYWEIGNEQYTATEGSETDFHPNPADGASYATYEAAFYADMRAQDSTIEIGIPVGLGVYSWIEDWTLPAMANAQYDAVVYHNYPIVDPITDGDTLYQDRVASNAGRTRGALLQLQTNLLDNRKDPGAIWVTEWNGEQGGDEWSKQTMGAAEPMFAAIQLGEYMQAGVEYATWLGEGGTEVCSTLNYDGSGETAYSWWECGGAFMTYTGPIAGVGEVDVGLKPGDLSPAGRAVQVVAESGLVVEGEHILRTFADPVGAPWLMAYAATHGASYAVMLINRDRDVTHVVPVQLAGKTGGTGVKQWTYGRAQYDETRNMNWSVGPVSSSAGPWSATFHASLPPWSVKVLVFE
jgi:hypothetical protein